jgi:hypothetical protein
MESDRNTFSEVFMIRPAQSFPPAVSNEFTWSRIGKNRSYQLKHNDEIVGTLKRPSFWSANFVAETPENRWTFRRSGFLGSGSEILETASAQPLAMFKQAWAGTGAVTFHDGEAFRLECRGLWHPVWTITAEDGTRVLQLHSREKTVEVSSAVGVTHQRLALLMMFAWYRVLQGEEDVASAAMVAIAG